jgi:glutamate formiminotransferase/formiminotetrahydrofolate cyclodeaminase
MANPIVECIANYSEARRPEVVEEIAASIQSVPGVRILDRHSDLDHNRTVITFVGPPEQVEEAAFHSIQTAARRINLDEHHGEHPRIGATDVVPFVPVSDISMADCVEMARRLGKRVGETLEIPVYLYEEAAARPERQNLENIRRGQYEALKEELGKNPARNPDFGPARLGPAGATVIGARHPLIAYNVYLTTEDVSIAKAIAKSIRHSTGGLRYVKALGLLVEGRAQVSMNLTNFRGTPIARVVEMIRREAGRYGVSVHHSELVGLIPQDALVDSAAWFLQLDGFEREQILEQRLASAVVEEEAEVSGKAGQQAGFLEKLASAEPTPGGGAAAACSAAMGAALVEMVARLTIGRKKYAAAQSEMEEVLSQAEVLRSELASDAERDAAAFDALMAAYRLPKETQEEQADRQKAVEEATAGAAQVPLEVAGKAVAVMRLALSGVSLGNLNALSDGATGAALARAALAGAGYNVRTNVASLQDTSLAQQLLERLYALEREAAEIEAQIHRQLQERGGMTLV